MKAQVVTYWSPEDVAEQCTKTASLLEKGDINTLEDVAEAYASVTHDKGCRVELQTGTMETYRLTQARCADVRLDSEGRIQQVFYDFHGAYVNLFPGERLEDKTCDEGTYKVLSIWAKKDYTYPVHTEKLTPGKGRG